MRNSSMSKNKEVRKVTIVGTGAIGASWTALYLARGFNVVATDPAPNAEADLRRFIDAAWTRSRYLDFRRMPREIILSSLAT